MPSQTVNVAQLVRASDCDSEGRGFESHLSPEPRFERGFLLMDFVVYILQSEKDGSFYIGQTGDLPNRLKRHNQGLEKYTSRKVPWKLYWSKSVESRSEAVKLERKIKNLKSRLRVTAFVLAHGGPVGPVA